MHAQAGAPATFDITVLTQKPIPADLQTWAEQAVSNNIADYTVPWVASGSKHGFELAMEWINSEVEHIAATGWATMGSVVALTPDDELDIAALKALIIRVTDTIHIAPNRVRKPMNNFIISVGCYVTALTDDAIAASKKMGTVMVDADGTACKVPVAAEYIEKTKDRGAIGKKKKTVKC